MSILTIILIVIAVIAIVAITAFVTVAIILGQIMGAALGFVIKSKK